MKRWIATAFLINLVPGLVNGFWITGRWPLTAFQHGLLDIAQFVVLPVATAVLVFHCSEARAFFRDLAWPRTPSEIAGSIVIGIVVGASGVLLLTFVAAMLGVSRPPGGLGSLASLFPSPQIAALYLATTAAVAEEFVFRYLPLAYLAPAAVTDRGKWIAYLLASCVLFGLIHWENGAPGIVMASFWGFTFGFMFWAFRNPVTIVVAHFTADLIYFWPN